MDRRWFLTLHALRRCDEMKLSRADVVDLLEEPDVLYPAREGRRMAVRDDYAVVFEPHSLTVVTVLYHSPEVYQRPVSV